MICNIYRVYVCSCRETYGGSIFILVIFLGSVIEDGENFILVWVVFCSSSLFESRFLLVGGGVICIGEVDS